MIGPFGRIALGPTGSQVTFTCDPRGYRPWAWKKRVSYHPGLQGAMTVQDFGAKKKDLWIELEGPPDAPLDPEVAAQLHGFFRTEGALYRLTDWCGNDFSVFIDDFQPVPDERNPGYAYTMRLKVLNINTLFGAAFSGP